MIIDVKIRVGIEETKNQTKTTSILVLVLITKS